MRDMSTTAHINQRDHSQFHRFTQEMKTRDLLTNLFMGCRKCCITVNGWKAWTTMSASACYIYLPSLSNGSESMLRRDQPPPCCHLDMGKAVAGSDTY